MMIMVCERLPQPIGKSALIAQIAQLNRTIHQAGSFEDTPSSVLSSYVHLLRLHDHADFHWWPSPPEDVG